MDVACIGLMVCDVIAKPVDESVFRSDSIRLETLKIASGGDALNAAINMSRLGLQVCLAGKVGIDALGNFLLAEASGAGVDCSGVKQTAEYPTSTSVALVEASGERHFAYYGKANDGLAPEDVDDALLKYANIVHVGSAMALAGLDGPGLGRLFKRAKGFGATTSMDVTWDSSGQWLQKIEEALPFLDIFLPSFNEARMITGRDTPEGMRAFFSGYPLKAFAVKLGADGCYATDMKKEYYVPAFPAAAVIDTTGAGDAFVSGFIAGIAGGLDIQACGALGNAAASLTVAELGATTRSCSRENVFRLAAQRFPSFFSML